VGKTQAKRQRLSRLFEAYASNLTACATHLRDTFACPLCLREFSRTEFESGVLTEEHVISRILGGRLITLTCKECNSNGGAELDVHLVNEFRFLDGIEGLGDKPFRGRVKMRDAKQDVEVVLQRRDGSPVFQIVGDEKRSNPASVRAIMQAMEEDPEAVSFQVDFGFDRHRANVAKLRAAYLLMFSYFGYEYVLRRGGEEVRRQILAHEQDVIASKASFAFEGGPEELNSVGLMKSPPELRCFVVNLKVTTEVGRAFTVILPGLDDESSFYDRWYERREALEGIQPEVTYILRNPNPPSGYIYLGLIGRAWDDII
jgi:hypothetical protein